MKRRIHPDENKRKDDSTGGRMDRLQFYLEPSLNRELERLAAECNVSKAELIRDGVRKVVEAYEQIEEDPIMKIVGLGKGKVTDGSVRHDDYLYRP